VKLAILGGSYNPVHVGHLCLADAVLSLGYDRIILVPAFESPFKPGVQDTSAADRLDMLTASIPGDPRITIDDCELRRTGVSFTIDTIEDITGRYRPDGRLGLVLGDDLARDFHRWHRAADIVQAADIVIAHRLSAEMPSFPYPFTQLDNDIISVSSCLVRARIQARADWRYLVPPGARRVIEDRRLYGLTASIPGGGASLSPTLETIARIETAVRAMVSPSRFLHSRNTALLSYDLSVRFGLDPRAGYLAGIAHDMCKSLGEEELRILARKDRGAISKLEKKKPSLLHARAAAVLLRERFGISDERILDAIRFHTTGSAEMGALAKVVYIADKTEPCRVSVSPELRERVRSGSLDDLFIAVLDETVAFLRARKMEPSEGTLQLLSSIHRRKVL
jgi:nicotinate-nucleotide adenylyltransferase